MKISQIEVSELANRAWSVKHFGIEIVNERLVMNKVEPLKVHYRSGLGNQLFQFAFAHFLQIETNRKVQMYRPKVSGNSLRPLELSGILELCNHLVPEEIYDNRNPFQRLAAKPAFKNFPYGFFGQPTPFYETKEFTFLSKGLESLHDQNYKLFGFWQHNKYVNAVQTSVLSELELQINTIKMKKETKLQAHNVGAVMHFRRGDTDRSDLKLSLGSLDIEYYANALDTVGIEPSDCLILTDDEMAAQEVARKLGIKKILGPSSTNAWETLKIMTEADTLVMANSTLSWWGGYVCSSKGKRVIKPNRWFRNLDTFTAFEMPNSIELESTWER